MTLTSLHVTLARTARRGSARRLTLAALAFPLLAAAAGAVQAQELMVEGKRLFTSGATPACAVCHTLAHAGAAGQIGPVLDELQPDAARVEKAIRQGINQMPAYRNLTDAEITTLSRYVAKATGGAAAR